MFGPGPSFARLVVYEGFHADGDEGERRVIMRAIQVCVGGYFWIGVALAEEEELPFRLGDDLAPKVEGESGCGPAEDRKKVILPKLDDFSSNFLSVVVGWNKLVRHP